MCEALTSLLDNIYIRFGCKLYRQIAGILTGTKCAPLVADLFLFCYVRDFILALSDANQFEVIEAFNSTSRYLDDLLNIDNTFFGSMVNHIYPSELQLNKANVDDINIRNKVLTAKLLTQRYRYHKLRKAFSKFYRRNFDLVYKYNVGLKTLLSARSFFT